MDRRDFLRTAATTAAGAAVFGSFGGGLTSLVGAPAASAASTTTPRYRGTTDGKIYVSYDNGRTWQLLVNFGPEVAVAKVKADTTAVTATLANGGYGFNLKLNSGDKFWRTV